MTNKEIVDSHLPLIKLCIDYQFSQSKNPADRENKEDFHQDLIIILYEYDNDKLNDALNKGEGTLNALITRIIINNIYSKTSKYYRDYKRFPLITEDIYKQIEEEDSDEDTDI